MKLATTKFYLQGLILWGFNDLKYLFFAWKYSTGSNQKSENTVVKATLLKENFWIVTI